MLQTTYTNCSVPLFDLGLVFICFLFLSFEFATLLVWFHWFVYIPGRLDRRSAMKY
jgi:hypothetical protein